MTHEVFYRVSGPVLGQTPGRHRSRRGDSGLEFRGHASLLDAPDPRRLDLHASLRDPFGDWRVRLHSQRRAVPVWVLADLSASMAFAGQWRKPQVLADLVDSLSLSAWRSGDSFGFLGCDARVRSDWLHLPTRARGAGHAVARALRDWQGAEAGADSAEGLLQAWRWLGHRRGLVFLVSDFHLPLDLLREVLASLSAHEVVPVALWDEQEFDLGPSHGLARVFDPESGRRRLVWWRPALRERWRQARAQRREALLQLFAVRRLKPLFIEQGYDADAVTRHFLG